MIIGRKKLFKKLLHKYINKDMHINELLVLAELLGINTTNCIYKNKLIYNINNKLNSLII